MSLLADVLARRRLIVAATLLLATAGFAAWQTMPREEDPPFPERDAILVIPFPGADAETVERLVLEPVEEHLAEVAEIDVVTATARAGVMVLRVELDQVVYDTDEVWDDVEDALGRARREFPAGVGEAELDHDLVSQESIVLAITGSADPLRLLAAAKEGKRRLLSLSEVKEVTLLGDPGEQITIEYDDVTARRVGLDPRLLGAQLARRAAIVPGGVIHLGEKTANLRPRTEFESLEEIRRTQVLLPSGSSVPLAEMARVRHGPAEPATERMRWRGEPAIGLGVIPVDGLNSVEFGARVREELAGLRASLAPLRLEEVFFQPDQVSRRLSELSRSLLLGIVIVAVLLLLAMGPRLGLLVALVLPLVTFASVAVFAAAGGLLNQISIAALVIALGMLVDNAIVVAENIQYRIDQGMGRRAAAEASVKELALPLGTATGTTLAAFVPMLLSKGATADFTRSIPVLIMLTLSVSYLFAVLVTPVLAELLLAKRARSRRGSFARARKIAELGVRRPGAVLAGALLLLAFSAFSMRWVDRQFFPAADREIMVVSLQMPEGTHLERTDEAARELERALEADPRVVSVASFVGRGVPKFYYNLPTRPESPHLAQMVVTTESLEAVEEMILWTRDHAGRQLPEAEVVAQRLEQGPPIAAPIELRLYGTRLEELAAAADRVVGGLRAHPATRDVRQDLGLGVPTVTFAIDDAAAGRFQLSRTDVAQVLRGRTLGAEIGQYRMGEDPIPILLRSSAGERLGAGALATVEVAPPGGKAVPLEQLASLGVEWKPAAIHHRNRQRVVTVLSQLEEGRTADRVLSEVWPRLAALELPGSVRLEVGGEAAESGEANSAILRLMPIGLLLLLFFLLLEFNSFRRVGIVLATVPLAATGVVPGLALSGQPFGFMSLLGVISLVGIVVNNAIVLLDVIERKRAGGASVEEALLAAVARRTRPILLTMATTIAGLSPLAFSETSLWPPLAWAMISGLSASTLLTLLVIPALYKLLFTTPPWLARRRALAGAALVGMLLAPGMAEAGGTEEAGGAASFRPPFSMPSFEPLALTLEEALARAAERPVVDAAAARARITEESSREERRRALLPTVEAGADLIYRSEDFMIETPIGAQILGDRQGTTLSLRLTQPLLDPPRMLYRNKAGQTEAAARRLLVARARQEAVAEAGEAFLGVLAIDARMEATRAFLRSLEERLREAEEKVEGGKALAADALKVRLDLESARLELSRLARERRFAAFDLGRAVGLDRPVAPVFDGRVEREADLRPEALAVLAYEGRPDLAALYTSIAALELRVRAVRAERLPRLEARAGWTFAEGDPLLPREFGQGSLNLVWRPFEAGTRTPRAAALEAEVEALRAEAEEARRSVIVGIDRALSTLASAREAVAVRERAVEWAGETLRVERRRHGVGRATTNELLAAEAALRREVTARDIARLEVLASWIRLRLAVGVDDLWESVSGGAPGPAAE